MATFCFNPRPHAAGDSEDIDADRRPIVSIHARTRRATVGHSLRWSARRCFNPRPHAAGDVQCLLAYPPQDEVSIHARTRRATETFCKSWKVKQCFNPRPHAAGDEQIVGPPTAPDLFQSTPARGGRRPSGIDWSSSSMFQSTPARGGRLGFDRPRLLPTTCFNPRPHAAGDGPVTDCNR